MTIRKEVRNLLGHDKSEGIAVVGFAIRFPQDAEGPDAFWKMILEGRSAMTEFPQERLNINGYYSPDRSRLNSLPARGGHFLKEDISKFDAPFFSMGASEAKAMDPQLRGLLEVTYCAFENAGMLVERVHGSRTSVFIGNTLADYEGLYGHDEEIQNVYKSTGTSAAMLSNRLSWFYGLQGPSLTVDTACSSSLIALHLACQNLWLHESDMCLVGGCNLYLDPAASAIPLSNLGFISPDSVCHSFDEAANGYSKGEGLVAIILKRATDAIRDGDSIRGVIRGTGANQDGRTPSISQPSPEAQADLIQSVYDKFNLNPALTRFFEAHGTGTSVGDPMEADAISRVFKSHRSTAEPLYVGALKANIGHLEAASGLAGLVKTILVLEKGVIPPIALLKNLNSKISADWNLNFPTEPIAWPRNGVRRASVNAFGYGGTNAHIVLDDAASYLSSFRIRNTRPNVEATSTSTLIVFSAADEGGNPRIAEAFGNYMTTYVPKGTPEYLHDLAYTLSEKRTRYPWKSYALIQSFRDLKEKLSQGMVKPVRSSVAPTLHFVFTGQGAQWARMGAHLLDYAVFQSSILDAESHFRDLGAKWSLLDELKKAPNISRINDPDIAQPACTALQIAMVDLLGSWHIHPCAVVGHSSGEIAAAYSVGAISKKSAWTIAYLRGEMSSRLLSPARGCRGAMLAVSLSAAEVERLLHEDTPSFNDRHGIYVGCINSPNNTTVTGSEYRIDVLKRRLDERQIFARKLNVPIAYHSIHMIEVADGYRKALNGRISPYARSGLDSTPVLFSTVTGKRISLERLADPDYWVENLVSPVLFYDAVHQMRTLYLGTVAGTHGSFNKTTNCFIEIGPHAALERPIKETLLDDQGYTYEHTLRRGLHDVKQMKELAGKLFVRGYPVDISAVNTEPSGRQPQMLVDLPAYPFNHSQSYWLESRLSKNRRFRKQRRHELLGSPSDDWNPQEAKWRFTIRVSEHAWIQHHVISGSQLYPAAGMLVMVIEATRQLCMTDATIHGYRLRDVTVHNAVEVPDTDDGTELQLHMNPQAVTAVGAKQQNSWTFRIYAIVRDESRLISSGCIAIELGSSQSLHLHRKTEYERTRLECTTPFPTESFYRSMREIGGEFGPSFQTLHDISFDPECEQACARMTLGHWHTIFPDTQVEDHVVHPTVLDALFQLPHAAISRAERRLPTMIPTHLEHAWIAHRLLKYPMMTPLALFGQTKYRGIREVDFSSTVIDAESGELLISFDPFRLTAITALDQPSHSASQNRRLCYHFDWKPDPWFMHNDDIAFYCSKSNESLKAPLEQVDIMVCLKFMEQALNDLDAVKYTSPKSHIRKYSNWARQSIKKAREKGQNNQQQLTRMLHSPEHWAQFLSSYASSSPCRNAHVQWGYRLPSMLRGELDPLHLLFNEGLATDIYQGPVMSYTIQRMCAYVDLLAHKDSSLHVLEVGAGIGSGTEHLLRSLSSQGSFEGVAPRFRMFDFTDISPSFFEGAKMRFEKYSDRMRFKTLDIERDPTAQGFEKCRYDIIVAVSVLHATASIDEALEHLRSLLKPGGHLLLVEPTNPKNIFSAYVSGVLPGWWRSKEADRAGTPLYTRRQWDDALVRAGFTGLDIFLPDNSDENDHVLSFIASRVPEVERTLRVLPPVLLIANTTPQQQAIALRLQSELFSHGFRTCDILDLDSISTRTCENAACIFLLELEHSFLIDMDESQFSALKHIFQISKNLLWITMGGGEKPTRPEADIISGLGKTISIEKPTLRFSHIDVESDHSLPSTVLRVLEHSLTSNTRDVEIHIAERKGLLYVPRIIEAVSVNSVFDTKFGKRVPEAKFVERDFKDSLELQFTPGSLDSLHYVTSSTAATFGAGEIEVQVKATGINFKDVMVALGQLSDNHIGQEFAGVVTRTGPKTKVTVGMRVCGIVEGSFKTFVKANECAIMPIPDDVGFTEAATLPLAFVTAHYGLTYLAALRKGESILIHAAAGAVGQAAIQLAQRQGAVIYVTVSSTAKKQLLIDRYQLDEANFFSSRDLSFSQGILQATGGRGIDVVLNSLAGDSLTETWRVMAPLGRFVEIGKRDINAFARLPMAPFAKNVTFASLDVAIIYKHNPDLLAQIMSELQEMLFSPSKSLTAPYPIRTFKRSEFEEAFRYLQTGKQSGKAVVDWTIEDTVQVVPEPRDACVFPSDATYVIAGGLGGIGRSIARWMASRGAKNLILLSRSGATSSAAQELLQDLGTQGVNVESLPCDISDAKALDEVLTRTGKRMPPIRGCIQASMVVQNRTFDKMTLSEFNAPMHPKVTGTWNLHHSLPSDLDFFILLSSLGGVGGASAQCNYAAACSFQDAFARYRHSLGQRCTSLDLGIVASVGYIAERVDVAQLLTLAHTGHDQLEEHELLFMVEQAIVDPIPSSSTPWSTQLLGAVTTPALVRKNGLLEEHAWMQKPLFRHLYQIDIDSASSSLNTATKADYSSLIKSCNTVEEAGAVIAMGLAKRLSRSLVVPEEDIDLHKPAHTFGVDSLVAVELQFWFSNEMKADLTVLQILGGSTIQELGIIAAEKSAYFAG